MYTQNIHAHLHTHTHARTRTHLPYTHIYVCARRIVHTCTPKTYMHTCTHAHTRTYHTHKHTQYERCGKVILPVCSKLAGRNIDQTFGIMDVKGTHGLTKTALEGYGYW